jgi:hypothetical protein
VAVGKVKAADAFPRIDENDMTNDESFQEQNMIFCRSFCDTESATTIGNNPPLKL